MSSKEYELRDSNQNKNNDSTNSFLLGAIIGGMVGAAAALLFAPKSGKEIRSTLNNQAGSFKEKTLHLRENMMNKDIVQQSADLLNKAINRTKSTWENEKESEVEETEINYIPIQGVGKKTDKNKSSSNKKSITEEDITKKLEEAKKALAEEENKVAH